MLRHRLATALVIFLVMAQSADARQRRLTPEEVACWRESREKIPNRMKCAPTGLGTTFCENEAYREQRGFVRECLKRPRDNDSSTAP